MIAEFWISLGSTIATWFASLWPDWTPPAFLTSFPGQVNSLLSNLSGVGVWADWGYLITVVGVVVTVYVSGFAIKFGRWIWSLIPVIGGGG